MFVQYIALNSILFAISDTLKRGQRDKFCTKIMSLIKVGQTVKFQNPFSDEDPEQKYIVLEVKEGKKDTRVDISPLNSGLEFPPVYTVKSEDLVWNE